MTTAPIVLFVYNRPEHAQKTVLALQENEGAGESNLYIYSDAARSSTDAASVSEVRRFIRTIKGFKTVTLVERETNLGLAASIISGVTEVISKHGTVIVLEDDLVASPFFLRYMNSALAYYRDEEKVMHISGCTYPVGDFCRDDTYFLRVPLCWGWATWKRAWDRFEKNTALMDRFSTKMISAFNFDGTYPYWRQLEMNRNGTLDTWFVFWYAKVFLSEALSLFPRQSLVCNIGHDGTGEHCGKSEIYRVELSPEPITIGSLPLQESQEAVEMHKRYFRRICPGRFSRLMLGMKQFAQRLIR